MKKLIAAAIGLGLVLSTVSLAQDPAPKKEKKAKKKKAGKSDKKM